MSVLVCRNVECSWEYWNTHDEFLCPTHHRRDCPNCHGTVLLISDPQWKELSARGDDRRLYRWLRKGHHDY